MPIRYNDNNGTENKKNEQKSTQQHNWSYEWHVVHACVSAFASKTYICVNLLLFFSFSLALSTFYLFNIFAFISVLWWFTILILNNVMMWCLLYYSEMKWKRNKRNKTRSKKTHCEMQQVIHNKKNDKN